MDFCLVIEYDGLLMLWWCLFGHEQLSNHCDDLLLFTVELLNNSQYKQRKELTKLLTHKLIEHYVYLVEMHLQKLGCLCQDTDG